MTDTLDPDDATKRLRSPPYPSADLSKAVERAKALYGKALHHSVSASVLGEAWGYGAKSSGLFATAATLAQFGLLVGQGTGPKRRYQLTDTGMRIIRDADPASEKRLAAIKRAALAPAVYQELWETYGLASEVSDVVLRNFLTLDRLEDGKAPYGDEAASDIIQTYKATLAYAGLSESDILPPAMEDKSDGGGDAQPPPSVDKMVLDAMGGFPKPKLPDPPAPPLERPKSEVKLMAGERELVTGLLSKESSFRVIVSGAVGVKEIERLIKKLELDKEILADADDDHSDIA